MQRENKRMQVIVGISVVLIILSFLGGYYFGMEVTIKAGLYVARSFTNISIDEALMKQALFQYKNNIGGCYAPLHNYTGNKTLS